MSQVVYNPKCGLCLKPIPNVLHDVKIAGCPHCGSYSTMGEDGYLRHQLKYHLVTKEYQKPYYLGEHIAYQGLKYTVFAVYMYHVEYDEWDTEDQKWVLGTGYVTEWYAQKSDNTELVIMSDVDDKFYIITSNRKSSKMDVPTLNECTEVGKFTLWGFIGTDAEPLEVGGFYRYRKGYTHESKTVDFSDASTKSYWKHKLTSSQVKRMVVIGETKKTESYEKFKNITFYRNLFALAFLAIFMLFVVDKSDDKEGIKGDKIAFDFIPSETNLDTAHLKPQLAGTFDLKANKNYQFKAKGFISNSNQDGDCTVTIVRHKDKAVVQEALIDFYRESGNDDEGYWEENVLEDGFKFQTDEAGLYEVFVAPDYENLGKPPINSIVVEIGNTSYSDFYWWAIGLLLLLVFIFQWQREHIVAYANLNHGTYLHDMYDSLGKG
jgi:hypothetical protein